MFYFIASLGVTRVKARAEKEELCEECPVNVFKCLSVKCLPFGYGLLIGITPTTTNAGDQSASLFMQMDLTTRSCWLSHDDEDFQWFKYLSNRVHPLFLIVPFLQVVWNYNFFRRTIFGGRASLEIKLQYLNRNLRIG